MYFTFSGGTQQQVKWAMEAVAGCTFDLGHLYVDVELIWGAFPGNIDTRHPYMVTEVVTGASYQIYIAPWADDPTNGNNQGLPDPAGDIKQFYMQSVVHELGHVVTYCTFDPAGADTDPRVTQVCALFWRPEVDSGPGRRYGTLSDWDAASLAWADEIREAVAEMFKVTYFTGRLIFMNRTNWRIDQRDWAALLSLWSYYTPLFFEPFKIDASYDPSTNTLGGYTVGNGSQNPTGFSIASGEFECQSLAPGGSVAIQEMSLLGPDSAFEGAAICRIDQADLSYSTQQSIQVSVGAQENTSQSALARAWLVITGASGASMPTPQLCVQGGGPIGCVTTPSGPLPVPLWLVCRISLATATITAELWTSDPSSGGGSPEYSVSTGYVPLPTHPMLGGFLQILTTAQVPSEFINLHGVPGCQVSDWQWANHLIEAGGAYPLGPGVGQVDAGAFAAGVLLVGSAP